MAKRGDDIDALFKLSLTEFIGARKTLTARLKKSGETDEAQRVNALTKPPISAWTVNQLYWMHREEFDELVATGQRFRKAQSSGKMVNMREALDARREALSHLSDLATEILLEAGHNPSLDTLRRITTTLEALSSYSSTSDGPSAGRLTEDVDPPGFDSFGSFTPRAAMSTRATTPRQVSPTKTKAAAPKTQLKPRAAEAKRREDTRQARISAAKASLQNARKALTSAQAQAKSLGAAQRRAEAAAKEAEQLKRQVEERWKKARAAADDAARRAQSVAEELEEATKSLDEAKRTVDRATRDLEKAFGEPSV